MRLRILLTGGGTGGHLYPGLAIVEAMNMKMDFEVRYIGTRRGVENRVIPETGYPFYKIWMAGIHRGRVIGNLLFPLKMLISLIHSIIILSVYRPDVVIGTGGYVSWPVMTAAWLLRRSRFIQEQNQRPGLVTRTLAPLMQGVFLSFTESRSFFRNQRHLHVCGNPTRQDLETSNPSKGYEIFQLDPDCTTLFIFGGSQGARGINNAILARIDDLMRKSRLQILWAAGPRWIETVSAKTVRYASRIRVLPYISDMGAAYSIADIIVCRSGATTVAEITRLGKAALFIPFPDAAANHQEDNARALSDAGAAVMVLESEISSGKLDQALEDMIDNPQKRSRIGKKARAVGNPNAADCIADQIYRDIQVAENG
jgi:UDP-N-acetylglucosamine--N-acetylmuramyl-(pentapeptide) pyrophosphoryl-undecaprenol N-acetylglucosamine transferase